MGRFVGVVVGLAVTLNGVAMLLAPETWYGLVPTAAGTGPFNPHFVADVGCAYLVAGGGFLWYVADPRARGGALAGGMFLALHAIFHLWDAVRGRESLLHLCEDAPAVLLPAAIIVALAWRPSRFSAQDGNGEMVKT